MSTGISRGRPRRSRTRSKSDRTDPIRDDRTPDARFEEVRRWIREGGHNTPDVAEAVARGILAAGDLDRASCGGGRILH